MSQEISMIDLAKKILTHTNSKSSITFEPYENAYGQGFEDMKRRVPDTTKLQNLTGWRPSFTLDEIIKDLINTIII